MWGDARSRRSMRLVLGGVVLVALGATALIALGAAPAAADQHEPENAPSFNNSNPKVTFEITLPDTTDHYPGDHPVHGDSNGYNASIEYSAAGQEAFDDFDAEAGVWLDFIDIGAGWIDYSECDATSNTKVFGIDRDNDAEGTQADEDLIEHRKGSNLNAGGLTITFFDWSDLSGDPPYLAPEDAIVAAQGAGSNNGPCLKMTGEPGWYQVRAYANGTIADECTEEGNSRCEPDPKRWRGVILFSNYVYVCECDSDQDAREELGPPPNEADRGDGGDSDATPTPTPDPVGPTPTPTPEPADTTSTPTRQPATTPTPTRAPTQQRGGQQNGGQQSGDTAPPSGDSQGGDGQAARQTGDDPRRGERGTPTIAEAPGFTPIAGLLALLAAAVLVFRRE